jgi:hypothetical protein
MNIRLGLRLLRGSGRAGLLRLSLIVGGTALGVMFLLMALALPQILRARQDRAALRQPDYTHEGRPPAGWYVDLQRRFGAHLVNGYLVAAAGPGSPAPPGLERLPEPGKMVVSPGLSRLLLIEPGIRAVLPYRVSGMIAASGLAAPNELFAWFGARRADLPSSGLPFSEYGVPFLPVVDLPESALKLLGLAFLGLTGVPLAVYFAVCAQLSAASRNRRLAALRLIGMSARDTARVSAVETAVAAAVGAIVGIATYTLVQGPLGSVGLDGFRWYSADGRLAVGSAGLVVVGVPLAAALLGRIGARAAIRDALAVRRQAPPRRSRRSRLLVLAAGLGMMVALLGSALRLPQGVGFRSGSQLLLIIAVLVTGIGLAVGVGVIAERLASGIARRTSRLWLLMGMRRLEFEPAGPTRVVAGLIVVVFGMGFAVGILRDAKASTSSQGSYEVYSLTAADVPSDARIHLMRLASTDASAVVLGSIIRDPKPGEPLSAATQGVMAVFASCADFSAIEGRALPDCVDGISFRIEAVEPPPPFTLTPGTQVRYPTTVRRGGPVISEVVPAQTLRVPAGAPFSAGLLIPPTLLRSQVPETATVYLLSGTSADAIDEVSADVAALAPGAALSYENDNLEARLQGETFQRLLIVALVLGVIVALAAFVVAAVDRAVERRANLVALQVAGVATRTLRAAQAAQVGLLLAVGVALAVASGKLAEQLTVAGGGYDRSWTWSDLVLGIAVGGLVSLAGTVATVVAVPGRIDPALIRRE